MNFDDSYLAERRAERRRRVRSGMAGVGLLMALGMLLLWSYPTPPDTAALTETTTTAAQANGLLAAGATALR